MNPSGKAVPSRGGFCCKQRKNIARQTCLCYYVGKYDHGGSYQELYDFLEAGDVLEASGYEVEGLQAANHNIAKAYIALETALHL